MTFQIEDMHRLQPRQEVFSLFLNTTALPAQPGGWAATVITEKAQLIVSQLDGEDEWILDGQNLPNGLPVFFNGEGARYTIPRKIANAEIVAALNAAVPVTV